QDAKLWNGNERWIEIDNKAAVNGPGSYTFNPGNFLPGAYYIGGYIYDKKLWTVTNSHLFTPIIIPAPTFKLTAPTSGTYAPGQPITVTWTATNISANNVVSLCLDVDTKLWNGNEKWIEIDKAAASDGTYTFNPAGYAPGTYYIGGYLYDKKLLTFTGSHTGSTITISNNSSGALLGALNSSALTTKKNELAAVDSVLQLQDNWIDRLY
ncbi:MAG: Ig-like domain-containing protein, partial [Thermoguttaceae bacterium]